MFDILLWCDKNENSGFFFEFNGLVWFMIESYIFLRFFLWIILICINDCNYLIILVVGLKIIIWYYILLKKYKLVVKWIDILELIFYGIVFILLVLFV